MLGFSKKKMALLQDEIVGFAELERAIHQPVKHYSAGMRARLGFSIASMLKPDIFIIDEALNAGDITFHEKSSAKIQELILDAKATIVVSHNMAFIEKVCTRALLLRDGELIYDGEPLDAIETYRNLKKQGGV
jgi:teichoic acid transport system ATP-binding protein